MRLKILYLSLLIFISCKKEVTENQLQKKKAKVNALLLGTFHFNNFNPKNNGDVLQVQIPDILTAKRQQELKEITTAIVAFKPDKIFVEYHHSKQEKLDSLYANFEEEDYKLKRNEIFQIGFRVAKELQHKRVYAMDYNTSFPYGDVIEAMKNANQFHLIEKDSLELVKIEKFENSLYNSNKTLAELLFYQNDNKRRIEDINWYLSLANQAGKKDNFIGAFLTSEWYKRNLYMYSLIQKNITTKDDKIMILAGASHIGMFKDFIDKNPEWKVSELKENME